MVEAEAEAIARETDGPAPTATATALERWWQRSWRGQRAITCEWQPVTHRLFGANQMPVAALVGDRAEAVRLLGLRREWDAFGALAAATRAQRPELLPWLARRPLRALALAPDWDRLLAVVEAYPDLKANQNMMQLTEELTTTENKVAFARQAYNDSVMAYNNRREVFPSSLMAGAFNFAPAALLDIPADKAEVREAPKVQF